MQLNVLQPRHLPEKSEHYKKAQELITGPSNEDGDNAKKIIQDSRNLTTTELNELLSLAIDKTNIHLANTFTELIAKRTIPSVPEKLINAALSPGISLKHEEKGWTIAHSKSMSDTDWTTTLNHLSDLVDHSMLSEGDADKLDKIAGHIENGLKERQSGFFAKIKDWILTRTSTKYVEESKALEEAHKNFKNSVAQAKSVNVPSSPTHREKSLFTK